eukprot:tig00020909_g15375.t1
MTEFQLRAIVLKYRPRRRRGEEESGRQREAARPRHEIGVTRPGNVGWFGEPGWASEDIPVPPPAPPLTPRDRSNFRRDRFEREDRAKQEELVALRAVTAPPPYELPPGLVRRTPGPAPPAPAPPGNAYDSFPLPKSAPPPAAEEYAVPRARLGGTAPAGDSLTPLGTRRGRATLAPAPAGPLRPPGGSRSARERSPSQAGAPRPAPAFPPAARAPPSALYASRRLDELARVRPATSAAAFLYTPR